MNYESFKLADSRCMPGVKYRLRRMSLARRIELTRQIGELVRKIEFLEGGASAREKVAAAEAVAEVERIQLLWGLDSIEGLEIDGKPATPQTLIDAGPEELCREVLQAIRSECGLSEEERKN